MRSLPVLSAFALGALVSWWVFSTEPVVRETTVVKIDTVESVRTEVVEDPQIGIPPDSVTPSRPAPNAGQRRALARALEGIVDNPPDVERQEVDDETKAAFIAGMRSTLEGANP